MHNVCRALVENLVQRRVWYTNIPRQLKCNFNYGISMQDHSSNSIRWGFNALVPRNHFVQEALIKVRSYVDCRVESVARKPKTLAMDSNHSSEEELEEIIKARSGRSCTNVATHHQTSAKSIEDLIEQKSRYEPIIILSAFFLHIFPLSTFNLIFTYLSFGTNSGFFSGPLFCQ